MNDLAIVRRRIQKQLLLLERDDLPRHIRWQVTKTLYYWYGFVDAVRGEKP